MISKFLLKDISAHLHVYAFQLPSQTVLSSFIFVSFFPSLAREGKHVLMTFFIDFLVAGSDTQIGLLT